MKKDSNRTHKDGRTQYEQGSRITQKATAGAQGRRHVRDEDSTHPALTHTKSRTQTEVRKEEIVTEKLRTTKKKTSRPNSQQPKEARTQAGVRTQAEVRTQEDVRAQKINPECCFTQSKSDDEEPSTTNWQSLVSIALSQLQLSLVPDDLPGRERELRKVTDFLEVQLTSHGGPGRMLFVAGPPGTGKTAVVRSAIRRTRQRHRFLDVEVNGLKLLNTSLVFKILHKKMFPDTKQNISGGQAYQKLATYFKSNQKNKEHVVLVIDEFDNFSVKNNTLTLTDSSNVFNMEIESYAFFDWPSAAESHFSVIIIANAVTLPDALIGRCRSRLGMQQLRFNPYTWKEIHTILMRRLDKVIGSLFGDDAIEFIARKTAAYYGDIRVAFSTCKVLVDHESAKKYSDSKIIDTQKAAEILNQRSLSESATSIWNMRFTERFVVACLVDGILKRRNQIQNELEGDNLFLNFGVSFRMLEEICDNKARILIPMSETQRRNWSVSSLELFNILCRLRDAHILAFNLYFPTSVCSEENMPRTQSNTARKKRKVEDTENVKWKILPHIDSIKSFGTLAIHLLFELEDVIAGLTFKKSDEIAKHIKAISPHIDS